MSSKPDDSKWVDYKDYDPDKQRSSSKLWAEDREQGDTVWLLQVRDLGFILMRATPDVEGEAIEFNGVSVFTDSEVGWRK